MALTSGSPFGTPPASLLPAPAYGTNDYRPAGSNAQLYANKGSKGRGASSKRPVLASGGTLEVRVLLCFRRMVYLVISEISYDPGG